mgnify:CR=1 FL=1
MLVEGIEKLDGDGLLDDEADGRLDDQHSHGTCGSIWVRKLALQWISGSFVYRSYPCMQYHFSKYSCLNCLSAQFSAKRWVLDHYPLSEDIAFVHSRYGSGLAAYFRFLRFLVLQSVSVAMDCMK